MYQLYRDRPLLVLCMVFANIVLSVWCLYLDPVINFDGVTYISLAQMILDGDIVAAFEHYSWPFYSIFIALIAKLLMIDVESAAFALNTLLATSLTLAFVCIVDELSNSNRRIILIAMVVILLFPSISKYRSFVIRDFGYLSCYLWSLYFIFRYCATVDKRHLVGWMIFAGLSFLFRFEGIVFILIAPYFLFLFSETAIPHKKKVLAILSAVIASVSLALLFWYINDKYMDSVEVARHSGKNVNGLADLFIDNIQNRLGEQPLTWLSFANLLFANLIDVARELIRRMAIFYFLFAIYAYVKNLTLRDPLTRKIWLIYVVTNLLMLLGFSLSNSFLVSRYTMASALTLLILAPFAIDHFIRLARVSKWRLKLGIGIILTLLTLVSLEGLDVATKKSFVKSSGEWMKEHLPPDARIYSNNKLAIYYAGRGVDENINQLYSLDLITLFLKTGEIKTYDYVALIGHDDVFVEDIMRQTLAYNFGRPIKMINTDDGRYAFIYSIQPPVWTEEKVRAHKKWRAEQDRKKKLERQERHHRRAQSEAQKNDEAMKLLQSIQPSESPEPGVVK